jgi:hypothetical protein
MPTRENHEERKLRKFELITYETWNPKAEPIAEVFDMLEKQSFSWQRGIIHKKGTLHRLLAEIKMVKLIHSFIKLHLPEIEDEIRQQLINAQNVLKQNNPERKGIPEWDMYRRIAQSCAEKEQQTILSQT